MVDIALSARTRINGGARVEHVRPDRDHLRSVRPVRADHRGQSQEHRRVPGHQPGAGVASNQNLRLSYSTTVNRPEFRELAAFEFTDVVGSRATRGNPDLQRALIQNVDARWEMFPGGRSILATSVFFKHFDKPIERVVIAGAQPIVDVPERRLGTQLRRRARSRLRPRPRLLRQRQLHLRRLEDHAAAGTADRCRRRWSVRWPASRRTCSTSPPSTR